VPRERNGDDATARSSSAGACSARSLSPRRKRPSRRRPTIAIDGERRATRPRRGDRNATNAIASGAIAGRSLSRERSGPEADHRVQQAAFRSGDCSLSRADAHESFGDGAATPKRQDGVTQFVRERQRTAVLAISKS
jgi:hypothetical protein